MNELTSSSRQDNLAALLGVCNRQELIRMDQIRVPERLIPVIRDVIRLTRNHDSNHQVDVDWDVNGLVTTTPRRLGFFSTDPTLARIYTQPVKDSLRWDELNDFGNGIDGGELNGTQIIRMWNLNANVVRGEALLNMETSSGLESVMWVTEQRMTWLIRREFPRFGFQLPKNLAIRLYNAKTNTELRKYRNGLNESGRPDEGEEVTRSLLHLLAEYADILGISVFSAPISRQNGQSFLDATQVLDRVVL